MRTGHQPTRGDHGRLSQAVKMVGVGSGTIGNRTLNRSPISCRNMEGVAIGHPDQIGLQRLQNMMDGIRTGPRGRQGKTHGRITHGMSGTPRMVLFHMSKGNLRENVKVAIKQYNLVINRLELKFSPCHRRQRCMMNSIARLDRCLAVYLRWQAMGASLHWHQG